MNHQSLRRKKSTRSVKRKNMATKPTVALPEARNIRAILRCNVAAPALATIPMPIPKKETKGRSRSSRQWSDGRPRPSTTAPATTLQRDIPVLLSRVLVALVLQHVQRLDELLARLSRLNHRIDKSAIGGHVRIGQAVAEFFDLLLTSFFAIFSTIQFALVDNIHRAFRPHHRNLGARPCVVDVG